MEGRIGIFRSTHRIYRSATSGLALTQYWVRHLARFKFTPDSAPATTVKIEVFPSGPSSYRPFFSATIQPINYTPSLPFSSTWLNYVGMSTHILQPPLPQGEPPDVVVGTDRWLRSNPVLRCGKAKMVWIDMKQPNGDRKNTGSGNGEGDALLAEKGNKNWWPGMSRWHLGLYCEDATLELGEPEVIMD